MGCNGEARFRETTAFTATSSPIFDALMMKMVFRFVALVLVVGLGACSPGPMQLKQENLDRVQEGMSAGQVKAILGSPTESKEEPIPVVGGTKTTYVYAAEGARIVIVLKNDAVQSKEGFFPDRRN